MRFVYSRTVLFLIALALVAAFLGADESILWGT
jgi:hypothetical protein